MGKWLESISGVAAPGAARKESEAEVWAQYARRAATALRDETALPEVNVFGPVLGAGEGAFFHAGANYARMWGGDGSYTGTGLLALGSPAFMVGAFAASGIINHRRKARAQRDAAVRWRDHQRAGLIATNHRLMVHTAQGWLSFYYGAVTEYYPDIENSSLTLGFGNQTPPMLLAGPPVRAAALLVAAATMPDRWTHDPRLQALFAPAGQQC